MPAVSASDGPARRRATICSTNVCSSSSAVVGVSKNRSVGRRRAVSMAVVVLAVLALVATLLGPISQPAADAAATPQVALVTRTVPALGPMRNTSNASPTPGGTSRWSTTTTSETKAVLPLQGSTWSW